MKRIALVAALVLACDKPSSSTTTTTTATASATASATATATATASATASGSATASASASAAPDASAEYANYTNSRYGFSIDYPTSMTKNPASANDAGQSFSLKSKASMRAWGFANSAHLTPKSLFEDWARRPGVSLKEGSDAEWTVGGTDRGKTYYSRCIYGADVVVCVEIQYDADMKDFEPKAKHVAESLKAKAK